jgi:protein SCO1/2
VPVIDQDGRKVMFYDDVIKGRIVVVSFIYTVCKDMCPLITARLALLQDKLGDAGSAITTAKQSRLLWSWSRRGR